MTPLIPAPNIEPNLDTTRDGHSRMQSFPPAPPMPIEILPKHCRSRLGQKRDPSVDLDAINLDLVVAPTAINEFTPPLIPRPLQQREIGAATSTVGVEIHHERAAPARGPALGGPVVVVRVVAVCHVALRAQTFDGGVGRPALEREGAGFEALDGGVAGHEGFFGAAN